MKKLLMASFFAVSLISLSHAVNPDASNADAIPVVNTTTTDSSANNAPTSKCKFNCAAVRSAVAKYSGLSFVSDKFSKITKWQRIGLGAVALASLAGAGYYYVNSVEAENNESESTN